VKKNSVPTDDLFPKGIFWEKEATRNLLHHFTCHNNKASCPYLDKSPPNGAGGLFPAQKTTAIMTPMIIDNGVSNDDDDNDPTITVSIVYPLPTTSTTMGPCKPLWHFFLCGGLPRQRQQPPLSLSLLNLGLV
jgi:hypothetical protein